MIMPRIDVNNPATAAQRSPVYKVRSRTVLMAFILLLSAQTFANMVVNAQDAPSAQYLVPEASYAGGTATDAALAVSAVQQRRLRRSDAVSPMQATLCPAGTFQWPKNSGFCWIRRETSGVKQGPGDNVFTASNVVLDSITDKLTLRMVKRGSRTSCAEVILDRSLGHGDYVWQIDNDPTQMHPSLVGGSIIYAGSGREFDIVYSKLRNAPTQEVAQYVVHPVGPGSQLGFYTGTGGRLTHRLRWSGSSSASQIQFETWTADGILLVSWTAQGGANFAPGDERVHMNHWISSTTSLPSSSSYTLSCFNFCPLGQETRCSTPMGQRPSCPPTNTPVTSSPSPSPPASPPSPSPPATPDPSPSPPAISDPSPSPPASPDSSPSPDASPSPSPSPPASPSSSPSPSIPQLAPCPAGQFRWPKDKDYCWWRRDSGGAKQGPGNNIFRYQNANIDERTDALVLTISADAGRTLSCGEVLTNRSLGFGDYVFTVQTDPSTIHHNLVGAPFIYAPNDASGPREFDVEYSRWGLPHVENTQYVVQPYTTNKEFRFNLTGEMYTHRIRWSGSSRPDQVQFETWSVSGQLVRSWTNTGGNNFSPGDERVHINYWIFAQEGVPSASYFVVTCFRHCPLGDPSCGALGTRPNC